MSTPKLFSAPARTFDSGRSEDSDLAKRAAKQQAAADISSELGWAPSASQPLEVLGGLSLDDLQEPIGNYVSSSSHSGTANAGSSRQALDSMFLEDFETPVGMFQQSGGALFPKQAQGNIRRESPRPMAHQRTEQFNIMRKSTRATLQPPLISPRASSASILSDLSRSGLSFFDDEDDDDFDQERRLVPPNPNRHNSLAERGTQGAWWGAEEEEEPQLDSMASRRRHQSMPLIPRRELIPCLDPVLVQNNSEEEFAVTLSLVNRQGPGSANTIGGLSPIPDTSSMPANFQMGGGSTSAVEDFFDAAGPLPSTATGLMRLEDFLAGVVLPTKPEPAPPARSKPFGGASRMRLLLVRHAQSANKGRKDGQAVSLDPGLTDLGDRQAEALGKRLAEELKDTSHDLTVVCSPMRRCILTILPTIKNLRLPVTACMCHGAAFEFGCAGTARAGSTEQEIKAEFSEFGTVGFNARHTWDYRGTNTKETEEECRSRAERLAEWIWGQVGRSSTMVLSSHQTISDVVSQIFVDGTGSDWEYGDIKYKLKNTAFTEIWLSTEGRRTAKLGKKNDSAHVPK